MNIQVDKKCNNIEEAAGYLEHIAGELRNGFEVGDYWELVN